MESMLNKVKEAVGVPSTENQQTAPQENTYGTQTSLENTQDSYNTESTHKTGPVHNNETLDKLDPRVQEQKTTTTHINPTDAAQAPPSVLKDHVDGPHIEHDHPHDSTTKRHSVSHQEAHLLR